MCVNLLRAISYISGSIGKDFENRWAGLWDLDEEQNPDGKNFMMIDMSEAENRWLLEQAAAEDDEGGWASGALYGKTHDEDE